ncbi:hypothetical protein MMC13_005108 [Lambiella insularis]|nr:hypothetical protein [Lambiella insularis]
MLVTSDAIAKPVVPPHILISERAPAKQPRPNLVPRKPAANVHPGIGKIDSTTLDCASYNSGGTKESCYNVCWYMNCFKGANSFGCGGDADTHRKESGCDRHPCTAKNLKDKEPFKGFTAHGGTGDGKYISDQPQCAGNKYKAMCKDYPKHKFSISFKNEESIKYCKKKPDCKNDEGQFHLASPYTTKDYKLGRRDAISYPEYAAMENEVYYGGMDMRPVLEASHISHNITRRDYRMSDGSTILLITRDPDHDYKIGSRHLQEDDSILTVVEKL